MLCSIDGCERPVLARGWCSMHYKRWRRRGGDPAVRLRMRQGQTCSVDACDTTPLAHGFCAKHLQRWQRYGDPLRGAKVTWGIAECSAEGCVLPMHAKGFCRRHYAYWTKYGSPSDEREYTCAICGVTWREGAKPGRPPKVCSTECGLADNASRAVAHSHVRDALIRGAPIPAEIIPLDEIYRRDNQTCHLCGAGVDRRDATLDHVIPVTRGGFHVRGNVKIAHRPCNTRKGNLFG